MAEFVEFAGGKNQAVVILRRVRVGLASCGVHIGRLVLFSDYGIEGEDRQRLEEIDDDLHRLLDKVSALEARRQAAVEGPVKDMFGATRE